MLFSPKFIRKSEHNWTTEQPTTGGNQRTMAEDTQDISGNDAVE